MKKSLFAIALMIVLVASCYADKSTFATFEYPEIEVTTNIEADTLSYPFGETIYLSAEAIQDGTLDVELEYSWELDLQPGSAKDRAFISGEKSCEYRVLNTPSSTPYILSLTVTNLSSGYSKILSWPFYVTNSLGEGILVGYTRDGGKTSEVDLVSAQSITYGYVSDTPRYTRELFSIGNGSAMEGRIQAIFSRAYTDINAAVVSNFNESRIMLGTNKHIYSLSTLTYGIDKQDDELIAGNLPKDFNTEFISGVGGYSSTMVIGNHLFSCLDLIDTDYSSAVYPGGKKQGIFSGNNTCAGKDDQGCVYVYDQEACNVAYAPGWCISSTSFNYMSDDKMPAKGTLTGRHCVACGQFKNMKGAFVLKDDAGKYSLLVVDYVHGTSAALYDLNAPEIENAVGFGFCDNTEIFYYITPTTIYTNVVSGGTVATKALSWKPSTEGEKLTKIQQYSQAWYGIHRYDTSADTSDPYAFPLSNHRLQMIIVTYNESTGEGKFYLRPFNVSTGMFSAFKNNGEYGGFGEITAVGTTMR